MKKEIKFVVELDKDNIPDKILWDAQDKDSPGLAPTRAISLALWDQGQRNTMRIDLWDKEMPVEDMKRFMVDCLGGIAQNLLNSTGDEYMATQINELTDKLVKHLEKEFKQSNKA